MEIDGAYCDVALRRFRKATGMEPVLIATGETFAEREARADELERKNSNKQENSNG